MGYGGSRPLLSILRLTPCRRTCSRSTDGACYTRGHMIAKELDRFAPQNRFEEAGQRAEEQMAFYLRREFGDDASVVVVNDLRLERQDGHGQTDAAQIDHVVVHPGGLVLVESKSVMSKVSCDEHGHWARHTGRYYQGMPSPVLQVERQGKFLRSYVEYAWPHMPRGWRGSVLVAISDNGLVHYVGRSPETARAQLAVLKADQIAPRIRTLSCKTPVLPAHEWQPSEVARLLIAAHRPRPFVTTHVMDEYDITRAFSREMDKMMRELWKGGW